MPPHTAESPAKKQSKWSPEEDALIIELRGSGMKWDDISKRLPGRSAISCRLHYQNYLERRSEWDEERKNKLARLYERFKPEMWAKVAEEMQVPWRAAEAMHWQLGEHEMARRAGVNPFTLSSVGPDAPPHRVSPSRNHSHSQSQSGLPRDLPEILSPHYGRGSLPTCLPPALLPPSSMAGTPRTIPPPRPPYGPDIGTDMMPYAQLPPPPPLPPYPGTPIPGPGLPPIQTPGTPHGQGRGSMLPGVAELTTSVSPYSTPAYSTGAHSGSPVNNITASPGLQAIGGGGGGYRLYAQAPEQLPSSGRSTSTTSKRRASPGMGLSPRETSRRRYTDTRQQ